jgi:hypothetical protein
MPDETKLPKWVRDELASLRNRVRDLERQASIIRGEAPGNGATGKVIADDLGRDGFPLHDRAAITFHLPAGKVTCMLREDGTILDLNCHGSMRLLPRAANSVWVEVAR